MASFLWGSSSDRKRIHWARWSKVCYPTEEGGLGVRALNDVQKAFSLKLWWKWKNHDSLWTDFIKAKYPRVHMRPKVTDSTIWRRLCEVHEIATGLSSINESGSLQWDPGINGAFSLTSAYNEVREHS
ncbi:unnamed protein product [Cuscuta europaea]|uniref:Uncharacterized protein n=1 Tax=Cuscuta europaea TaxID=41803 RepID=A0A9P1EKH7_CUSEU|nr:unnamed protein product [Cuscuta europaea]